MEYLAISEEKLDEKQMKLFSGISKQTLQLQNVVKLLIKCVIIMVGHRKYNSNP